MSGCNVEYINENWQDSQNAYVNTAIAYLVILTSGSGCRLLPKMQCAKWPCSGLPYDGAKKCEMRELGNKILFHVLQVTFFFNYPGSIHILYRSYQILRHQLLCSPT